MESEIKKIGNSQGLILPKAIIKEMNLCVPAKVELTITPEGDLVVKKKKNPREGWEELTRRCIELHGPEEPPIEIWDHSFDLEDWEWPIETLENPPEEGWVATLNKEAYEAYTAKDASHES